MTDPNDPRNPWRNPENSGDTAPGNAGGPPPLGNSGGPPPLGAPDPYAQHYGPTYQYGAPSDPNQQYPNQQYPNPGQPTGFLAPGQPAPGTAEPSRRSGGRLALMIGAAVVVVLAVLAGAVFGLVKLVGGDGPAAQVAQTSAAAPTTPDPGATGVAACGYPGTGESAPISERVVAGPLSFPVSAAPGWTAQTYTTYAQSSRAAGIITPIPGQPWQAGIEIGLTAFPEKILATQAVKRMVGCIVAGQGYMNTNPTVKNQSEPQEIRVDGVNAVKITADIHVDRADVTVPGDHLTVIVIDSAPQSYFLSDTPIGDDALGQVAKDVESKLKVARDV